VDKPVTISDIQSDHWAYRQVATAVQASLAELSYDKNFFPNEAFLRSDLAKGLGTICTTGPALRDSELLGSLSVIKGNVIVTQKEGTSHEATGKVPIIAGTKIYTGRESRAEMVFDDGSGILIEENTEIIGTKYIRQNGTPGVAIDRLELKLSKGKIIGILASRYEKIGQTPLDQKQKTAHSRNIGDIILASISLPLDIKSILAENENEKESEVKEESPWWIEAQEERVRVVVDMPWGVAGIRGTGWLNEVSAKGQSTSVIIGHAVVSSAGQSVSVSGGQSTVITSSTAPPAPPSAMTQTQKQTWSEVKTWVQERAQEIKNSLPAPQVPAIQPVQTEQKQEQEKQEQTEQKKTDVVDIYNKALEQATTIVTTTTTTTSTTGSSSGSSSLTDTTPVIFKDINLETKIRETLNKPSGIITRADMALLTSLNAYDRGIQYLNGMEYAINLLTLDLNKNQISDISSLVNLTKLKVLYLQGNLVSNISPLANLTNLLNLDLNGNHISNISVIASLNKLEGLSLFGNKLISDITPLANLTTLQFLDLGDNQISNISVLMNMTELKVLVLRVNQISDISPLANLLKLQELNLKDNLVSNISPLANLTNLFQLDLFGNQISNISVIANLTKLEGLSLYGNKLIIDVTPLVNLTTLQFLDLGDNQISNISSLANLTSLQDLRLWVNQISNISALMNMTGLKHLGLRCNQISDISVLANLVNLEKLYLEDNQISDISPLANLTNLQVLNLQDNLLNLSTGSDAMVHIQILINRGVSVTYLPDTNVPSINAVTAADTGNNFGLGNGDTLTIFCNFPTNQPPVATKANVDNLINFGGKSLGTNYSGNWTNAQTLVISVIDAVYGNIGIGDSISFNLGGNLRSADNNSAPSSATGTITGSFYFITPQQSGTFMSAGTMASDRDIHTSILLSNNKIMISGGYKVGPGYASNSNNFLGDIEIFNHSSYNFETVSSMVYKRGHHITTELNNGMVLLAGGKGGDTLSSNATFLKSAELYKISTNEVLNAGNMSYERARFTATKLLDGRVLIAGGIRNDTIYPYSLANIAELYNPDTNTFSSVSGMVYGRFFNTATLLPDGKVLITGGMSETSQAIASAELFNPNTGTFTVIGNMTTARGEHTATLLQNGKVLISGGRLSYQTQLNTSLPIANYSSTEIFDPSTGNFTAIGSMSTPRYSHCATVLPDGKVLISGGFANSWLSSAEIYDPVSGSIAPTGNMTQQRAYHRAAFIPQINKVLITGGISSTGTLNTSELYQP